MFKKLALSLAAVATLGASTASAAYVEYTNHSEHNALISVLYDDGTKETRTVSRSATEAFEDVASFSYKVDRAFYPWNDWNLRDKADNFRIRFSQTGGVFSSDVTYEELEWWQGKIPGDTPYIVIALNDHTDPLP